MKRMLKQGMPPPHPGEVLKGLYLDPLQVSVTAAAEKLGVTRKTLSQLINGHSGVSAEMAVRLSKALGTSPELWMNMQQAYDLWNAEKSLKKIRIQQIRKSSPSFRRAS